MSAERDLAEAIYDAATSPESTDAALDIWNECVLSERDRMWLVLSNTLDRAIDTVLARRQSEAARTGPWEQRHLSPSEQQVMRRALRRSTRGVP